MAQISHVGQDMRGLLRQAPAVRDEFWTEAGFMTEHRHTIHELQKLRRAAAAGYDILIYGRTGTGKEIATRMAHRFSPRAGKPCMTIDCTNLPETLAEAILFGHMPNAFTGAGNVTKRGLCDAAQGGVLFFDEVSKLPLAIQPKLLRLLENRTFLRVGGDREIPADIQVVAATNQDLPTLIEGGMFLEDLYYRLNVVIVFLPDLVDRRGDIALLAQHFLAEENKTHGAKGIALEAMGALEGYSWPGNVRELKNTIRRAHLNASSSVIVERDFEIDVRKTRRVEPGTPGEVLTLAEMERLHIISAIHACGGNRQEAARRLGIGQATLYRKIEVYGISGEIIPSLHAQGRTSPDPKPPPELTRAEADYIRRAFEVTCGVYRVNTELLTGRSRRKNLPEARQVAVYIMHGRVTPNSKIEVVFNQSRGFVLYAVGRAKKRMQKDTLFAERVRTLRLQVDNKA